MQSLKIVVTLLILIALGIVVGSNLAATMTVTILNQPTIALPIGFWLAISIGLGLLSSGLIQLLLFSERRLRARQIRQLKLRLQQQGDDVFTYTSAAPNPKDRTDSDLPPPPQKKSIFSSYRANFANSFDRQPAARSSYVDDQDDDWEEESIPNRQPEWDDPPLPSRSPQVSDKSDLPRFRPQIPRDNRDDVYDADFRLIQPPYKEPTAVELDDLEPEEEFEYSTRDRVKNSEFSQSSTNSVEEEDWGFDFNEDNTSVKNSQPKRK
ncbi:MAG: hypothetical protein RLZZ135_1156 [Cyanobacteriota bacterium]